MHRFGRESTWLWRVRAGALRRWHARQGYRHARQGYRHARQGPRPTWLAVAISVATLALVAGGAIAALGSSGGPAAAAPAAAPAASSTATTATTATTTTAIRGSAYGVPMPAPDDLTAEQLTSPVDVDASSNPTLGWQVGSGLQAAYQVQVASAVALLTASTPDVWNSGMVTSTANTGVGLPVALSSSSEYYWRVRTWDAAGDESPWSAPASFGTGPGSSWPGASPIWTQTTSTPPSFGNFVYTGVVRIIESKATLTFRVKDSSDMYLWQLGGTTFEAEKEVHGKVEEIGRPIRYPKAMGSKLASNQPYDFEIQAAGDRITTYLKRSSAKHWSLVDAVADHTFSAGSIGVHSGATERFSVTDLLVSSGSLTIYANEFTASDSDDFGCGRVSAGALVIGHSESCAYAVAVSRDWALMRGAVALRDVPISWAHIYATAGPTQSRQFVYKLSINGSFVGVGPSFATGDRTPYDGYDVTSLLHAGRSNVVGAVAYTQSLSKSFMALLVVRYADGVTQSFGTSRSHWEGIDGSYAIPAGPSVGTVFYQSPAEDFDSLYYPAGFDTPSFDPAESLEKWKATSVGAALRSLQTTPTAKVQRALEEPARVTQYAPGDYLIDYGRTWIGGLALNLTGKAGQQVTIRYGEVLESDRTVQYQTTAGSTLQDVWTLAVGGQHLETWGIRVFRYVNVIGAPANLPAATFTAEAYLYPFDATGAELSSTDTDLDEVWQLSKDTVQSTDLDMYVDSWERERTPYEADTYLQQETNLFTGGDDPLAEYSLSYVLANRTWPTEWPFYDALAAYDAYMDTGDLSFTEANYAKLAAVLPNQWFDPSTGVVTKATGSSGSCTTLNCDMVDWPEDERHGFTFGPVDTVINSIAYRAYSDMATLAAATGHAADAVADSQTAEEIRDVVDTELWDPNTGRFSDGMTADGTVVAHEGIQSSVFAVAMGLATPNQASQVARWLGTQGDACSVYCAAFLVQADFDGDDPAAGLQDLTTGSPVGSSAVSPDSWLSEIAQGAGADMEEWNPGIKANTTYSHPWGSSPGFDIPEYLFGLQPTSPGWQTFDVKPQPGTVTGASVTVPTVDGELGAAWDTSDGEVAVSVEVAPNTTAQVSVPDPEGSSGGALYVDGQAQPATFSSGYLTTTSNLQPGCHILTVAADPSAALDPELTGICK